MRLESMQDVLTNQLKDMLSAENQLTKALPKLAKAARSPQLREALENHLEETERQIERIEQAFESLGKRAQAKHCHGMEGLIKEGEEAMEAEGEDALVDTEIIAAAQRVEHYEISAYGTVVEIARQMGLHDVAQLLEESLEETKTADLMLTRVNEQEIQELAYATGMAGVGAESSSMGSGSSSSSARGSTSSKSGGRSNGGRSNGGKSGSTSRSKSKS